MSAAAMEATTGLVGLCRVEDLEPGWGEAAWVGGLQLAVFRNADDRCFASSHHCPGTGAKVMARGILGDTRIAGERVPTVACPLHKEVFRLDTGECLNADVDALPVFALVNNDGYLEAEVR